MNNWEFFELHAKQSDQEIIQTADCLELGENDEAIVGSIIATAIILQSIAASLAVIADHLTGAEQEDHDANN